MAVPSRARDVVGRRTIQEARHRAEALFPRIVGAYNIGAESITATFSHIDPIRNSKKEFDQEYGKGGPRLTKLGGHSIADSDIHLVRDPHGIIVAGLCETKANELLGVYVYHEGVVWDAFEIRIAHIHKTPIWTHQRFYHPFVARAPSLPGRACIIYLAEPARSSAAMFHGGVCAGSGTGGGGSGGGGAGSGGGHEFSCGEYGVAERLGYGASGCACGGASDDSGRGRPLEEFLNLGEQSETLFRPQPFALDLQRRCITRLSDSSTACVQACVLNDARLSRRLNAASSSIGVGNGLGGNDLGGNGIGGNGLGGNDLGGNGLGGTGVGAFMHSPLPLAEGQRQAAAQHLSHMRTTPPSPETATPPLRSSRNEEAATGVGGFGKGPSGGGLASRSRTPSVTSNSLSAPSTHSPASDDGSMPILSEENEKTLLAGEHPLAACSTLWVLEVLVSTLHPRVANLGIVHHPGRAVRHEIIRFDVCSRKVLGATTFLPETHCTRDFLSVWQANNSRAVLCLNYPDVGEHNIGCNLQLIRFDLSARRPSSSNAPSSSCELETGTEESTTFDVAHGDSEGRPPQPRQPPPEPQPLQQPSPPPLQQPPPAAPARTYPPGTSPPATSPPATDAPATDAPARNAASKGEELPLTSSLLTNLQTSAATDGFEVTNVRIAESSVVLNVPVDFAFTPGVLHCMEDKSTNSDQAHPGKRSAASRGSGYIPTCYQGRIVPVQFNYNVEDMELVVETPTHDYTDPSVPRLHRGTVATKVPKSFSRKLWVDPSEGTVYVDGLAHRLLPQGGYDATFLPGIEPANSIILYTRKTADAYRLSGENGVLLLLHGGPNSMTTISHGTSELLNFLFATTPIDAIVAPNYPGSIGYGDCYTKMLGGTCGLLDRFWCLKALSLALRYLRGRCTETPYKQTGETAPLYGDLSPKSGGGGSETINVIDESIDPWMWSEIPCVAYGASHGGFLGAHLVCSTANVFKGAILLNPVTDASMHTTDVPDWATFQFSGIKYGADVSTLEELQIRTCQYTQSPIANVEAISCPVLMLLGRQDKRVDWNQGRNFFLKLQALERTRHQAVALKHESAIVQSRCFVYSKSNHSLSEPCTVFHRDLECAKFINEIL